MPSSQPTLHVPAQDIPVPTSVSPEAQALMRAAMERIAAEGAGGPPDLAASAEAALRMLRPRAAAFRGEVETIDLGHGALLYRAVPEGRAGRRAEVSYFDVHGGGFVAGGGEMCRILAMLRASELGVEVWSVDYRLAPAHPFPAALDDCMAAWRHVLAIRTAADIVAAGSSAGGNLVAAMLLRGRDEGLPLPAALLMQTPVADMTGAGDTRRTNLHLDLNLRGGGDELAHYVGSADPAHPWLSPLNGDLAKGWPPTLLTSGTRDLLLSDTVRMHRAIRRAGVHAELYITEAGSHGGFMGAAPEDRENIAECRRFCEAAWRISV